MDNFILYDILFNLNFHLSTQKNVITKKHDCCHYSVCSFGPDDGENAALPLTAVAAKCNIVAKFAKIVNAFTFAFSMT